jgi:hypothetical protein
MTDKNCAGGQISLDRLDILDLFARYAHAVDLCDWEMLREVFSDDVEANYTTVAQYTQNHTPILHGIEDIIHYFNTVMPHIGPGLTHFMTNHLIRLDGDEANITSHNHVLNLAQGGVYHTHAKRTPKGWRLDRLRFEVRYFDRVAERMNAHMNSIDGRSV